MSKRIFSSWIQYIEILKLILLSTIDSTWVSVSLYLLHRGLTMVLRAHIHQNVIGKQSLLLLELAKRNSLPLEINLNVPCE